MSKEFETDEISDVLNNISNDVLPNSTTEFLPRCNTPMVYTGRIPIWVEINFGFSEIENLKNSPQGLLDLFFKRSIYACKETKNILNKNIESLEKQLKEI